MTITFSEMRDNERADYIGGAVEVAGKRGWYLGADSKGYRFIFFDGDCPHIEYATAGQLTALPDEPRMVIPGVTHRPVQQEPPEDMQGWWATHCVLGRVLIGGAEPDRNGDLRAFPAGDQNYYFTQEGELTDWSRERDIERPADG